MRRDARHDHSFFFTGFILLASCSNTSSEPTPADAASRDTGSDAGDATHDITPADSEARDARQADLRQADQRTPDPDRGPDAGENSCGGIGFIGACDGDKMQMYLSGQIFPYDCTNPALDYAGPDLSNSKNFLKRRGHRAVHLRAATREIPIKT